MHSIFITGIAVAMVLYITVGVIVGRKVKDINDYYVAGRNAPVLLIVGSLVASFLSTGAFLGDTGEAASVYRYLHRRSYTSLRIHLRGQFLRPLHSP